MIPGWVGAFLLCCVAFLLGFVFGVEGFGRNQSARAPERFRVDRRGVDPKSMMLYDYLVQFGERP